MIQFVKFRNRIVLPFLLGVLLLSSAATFGQGRKLYPGMTKTRGTSTVPISREVAYRWTWMVGLGRATYMGTLCDNGDCIFKFHDANFQLNLGLRYRFNSRISVGGTIKYFTIGASDREYNKESVPSEKGRYDRNLSFTTQAVEFQVLGRFDIIPVISKFMGEKADQYNRRNFIVPYVTGGGGLLYFNPTAELNGETYNLARRITSAEKEKGEFYSQFVPVVTGGLGVQIKLMEFFDVGLEFLISKPFTQYLDDVGGNSKYPSNNLDPAFAETIDGQLADRHDVGERVNPNNLQSFRGKSIDPLNIEKSLASPGRQDYYAMFNVHIDYTLSHLFKFNNPRHRHFQKGKGTIHHHFKVE